MIFHLYSKIVGGDENNNKSEGPPNVLILIYPDFCKTLALLGFLM